MCADILQKVNCTFKSILTEHLVFQGLDFKGKQE